MQKRQVVRLVRGDDQVVGHRRQALHEAADERAPREGHGGLAAPHAPALAARLDDHGHARAHVVLLHEVGEAGHVAQVERRHVVQLGGMHGLGDVGDHGHRVRRGQLVGDVHVVGVLRVVVQIVECLECGRQSYIVRFFRILVYSYFYG